MSACTSSEETVTAGGEAKKEAVGTMASTGQVRDQATDTASAGKELFKEHCAVCHHNGGNSVRPEKTLHRKSREKNGIKSAEDIIQLMRDPGPGMTEFNNTDIPDKDAKAIADYILKTF